MTDGTSLLPAPPRCLPAGTDSAIVTARREKRAGPGEAGNPARSHDHDEALGDAPGDGPVKAVMTWQGASDIVVRAALSPVDRYRILALPYPAEYQAFWQVLVAMGVTQERLMDRMGASP
jgi:hypothetical protein